MEPKPFLVSTLASLANCFGFCFDPNFGSLWPQVAAAAPGITAKFKDRKEGGRETFPEVWKSSDPMLANIKAPEAAVSESSPLSP